MIKKPEELYEAVVEVEERLVVQRDDCQLEHNNHPTFVGTTGEKVYMCLSACLSACLSEDCHPTIIFIK